jgi:preprotein translocase subunit SecY
MSLGAAPIASRARWGKRLAVTLGALALYRLGLQIPLPGLSAEVVDAAAARGSEALGRLSIFALGVRPLFGILFVFEIACLAFPSLRRVAADHDRGFERGLVLCAIALAALQGVELASTLEARPRFVEEPGVGFVAGIVGTFVGATALMIWLCDRIQIAGIGDGFWVLLAAPIVGGFAVDAGALIALSRVGALSEGALAVLLAFVVLAVAALVAARLARTRSPPTDRRAQLPEILWPPILAYYLAAYFGGPLRIGALALMFIAFTAMRGRGGDRAVWAMALAQIFACVGGEWITAIIGLPFSLGGAAIIIVVTLATNLLPPEVTTAAAPEAPQPDSDRGQRRTISTSPRQTAASFNKGAPQ